MDHPVAVAVANGQLLDDLVVVELLQNLELQPLELDFFPPPLVCVPCVGRVIELLVVTINFLHRLHPWIFCRLIVAFIFFFVPVVNPADKGGDQLHFDLGCTRGLYHRKEQRHIAMDPLLLKLFCREKALPGRRNLDQHPFAADSAFLI